MNSIRVLDKREHLVIIEVYFFLFLIETICCDPSSIPYRQDGSDKGSQHMFLCNINKRQLPSINLKLALI